MSPSLSALTASGLPGTVISWPQTQAVTKPPSAEISAGATRIGRPSLIERSADHRRNDPEIPRGESVELIDSSQPHFGHRAQWYFMSISD